MMRSFSAMCLLVGASALVSLVGCSRQREVRLAVKWDLTDTGFCRAPGRLTAPTEREVTLRYVRSPDHYETLCSTRLASHLAASTTNPVSAMFLYDDGTKGRSLCEVDGIVGTVLASGGSKSCTGLGHEGGGTRTTGGGSPTPNPFE